MLVHIFGAADSPCCANFAVKTAAKDILEKYSAMATETEYCDPFILTICENWLHQNKRLLA